MDTFRNSNFNFLEIEERKLLRIKDIIRPSGLLPISRTTWLDGVRSGKFPQPLKFRALGARITVWDLEDIKLLIETTKGKSDERS